MKLKNESLEIKQYTILWVGVRKAQHHCTG